MAQLNKLSSEGLAELSNEDFSYLNKLVKEEAVRRERLETIALAAYRVGEVSIKNALERSTPASRKYSLLWQELRHTFQWVSRTCGTARSFQIAQEYLDALHEEDYNA